MDSIDVFFLLYLKKTGFLMNFIWNNAFHTIILVGKVTAQNGIWFFDYLGKKEYLKDPKFTKIFTT